MLTNSALVFLIFYLFSTNCTAYYQYMLLADEHATTDILTGFQRSTIVGKNPEQVGGKVCEHTDLFPPPSPSVVLLA